MAYIADGMGAFSYHAVRFEQAVVFAQGDHITAIASATIALRFLLIAAQPIGESVVQHGPFVMNSHEEIRQAYEDFRSGKLQNPDDNVWVID